LFVRHLESIFSQALRSEFSLSPHAMSRNIKANQSAWVRGCMGTACVVDMAWSTKSIGQNNSLVICYWLLPVKSLSSVNLQNSRQE
jgi:hypothetical protein